MSRFGVKRPEGHTGVHASDHAGMVYTKKNISMSHRIETEVEAYGSFPAMPSNEYGSPRRNGSRNSVHDHVQEKEKQFSPPGLTRSSPWLNGTGGNSSPSKDRDHENETNKRNGYMPATYGVPISTQTKEPSNNRYKEKDKAEDYGAHARGTVPFATQTKDQTNYDALRTKPIEGSPPQYNGSFPALPSTEYGSPKNGYRNSSHDLMKEKNHQFSPRGPTKNSPWPNGTRDSSSPSRNDYNTRRDHGKHTGIDSYSDDEDGGVIRKDGVNKYSKEKDYYQNEPNKRNGYVSPSNPVPTSTPPKNGTGYEPSNNLHERKDKAGDYGARDPAAFAAQRKRVTNPEALKNNSAASSPPQYGSASSGRGTITCKEAADRYRGYRICEK